MRIRWTPPLQRICRISAITSKSITPHCRQATMRKLSEIVRSLKHSPHRGRPGSEEDTREILFAPLPYVAIYRVKEQAIEVLRIYHGAQDRT
jgi:plasmid stabilization system protein ParE